MVMSNSIAGAVFMPEISFGHATHVGHVRSQNEDCYGYDTDLGLFVIADGLGGHSAGDIASQIAIEHAITVVEQGGELTKALESAHEEILRASLDGRGSADMGTTAVALRIDDGHYQAAWVGDSRGYLWDGNMLIRITHDHSMVQELVDGGLLSAEDAKYYPFSNLLTRTLGVSKTTDVLADHVEGRFELGQQIMLCTDGLTNEVNEEDMKVILSGRGSEQDKVEHLIDLALSNGGSDNVTVLLVSAL